MKGYKLEAVKQFIKEHWLRYVLCLMFVTIVVVLVNSLRDNFTNRIFYSDGLFIAGALLIGYGLLIVVNYFGAFDVFQLLFNKKTVDGRKENLYEFSTRKKEERRVRVFNFLDFIIVGVICLIIAWLLLI